MHKVSFIPQFSGSHCQLKNGYFSEAYYQEGLSYGWLLSQHPPLKRKNVTPLDKFLIRHLILLFREYTYCDTPGDTELSTFNLTVDDTLYKIPYINQAKQISNKQVSLITLPSIFIFKEIIKSYSHTMKTIIQSNNEDDFQF